MKMQFASSTKDLSGSVWVELSPNESTLLEITAPGTTTFNQVLVYPYSPVQGTLDSQSIPSSLAISFKLSNMYEGRSGIDSQLSVTNGSIGSFRFPFRNTVDGEGTFIFLHSVPWAPIGGVTIEGFDGDGKSVFRQTHQPILGKTKTLYVPDLVSSKGTTFGTVVVSGVPAFTGVSALARSSYGIVSVLPPLPESTKPAAPEPPANDTCLQWIGTDSELFGYSNVPPGYVYLGTMSRDPSHINSLSNPQGPYGTASGVTIFNRLGSYGSSLSSWSPWDAAASVPPWISIKGVVRGYLSRNPAKTPRLDPDEMLKCIGRSR